LPPIKTDTLTHAIAFDGWVSVLLCDATQAAALAARRHKATPLAAAALGRLLVMGALMSEQLKSPEESFALTINGEGPLCSVVVDAHAGALIRGYIANPQAQLPRKNGKLDVGGGVGRGTLTVRRIKQGAEPYTCTLPLQTGEIAEDFAYYYAASVQQPSAVGLGVRADGENGVLSASGFLIQPFAGCPEEIIAKLEDFIKSLPPASLLFVEQTPTEWLQTALPSDHEILEQSAPQLFCTCGREAMLAALSTLPIDERKEMAREGPTEMSCRYCASSYQFTPAEVLSL